MSPDCSGGVVGTTLVALYCGSAQSRGTYELYNLRTRRLHAFPCRSVCQRDYYYASLAAIGTRWLELEVEPHQSCGDGVHNSCGPTTYDFLNVVTGKSRSPRVNATTIIDLDSRSLTRQICRPLQTPLTFFGSFAVAQDQAGSSYLERCGTRLHTPIVLGEPQAVGSLVGTMSAVMLFPSCAAPPCAMSGAPVGFGVFLPSLHRFTFALSSRMGFLGSSLAAGYLGPRRLYVLDTQGARLWAAAFPTRAPRSPRQ